MPNRRRAHHNRSDKPKGALNVGHHPFIYTEKLINIIHRSLINRPQIVRNIARLRESTFDRVMNPVVITGTEVHRNLGAPFKRFSLLRILEQSVSGEMAAFYLDELSVD